MLNQCIVHPAWIQCILVACSPIMNTLHFSLLSIQYQYLVLWSLVHPSWTYCIWILCSSNINELCFSSLFILHEPITFRFLVHPSWTRCILILFVIQYWWITFRFLAHPALVNCILAPWWCIMITFYSGTLFIQHEYTAFGSLFAHHEGIAFWFLVYPASIHCIVVS